MSRTSPLDVSVLLPWSGDAGALVAAVSRLVALWPDGVEAELVVAAALLDDAERRALSVLGGDVRVVQAGDPAATLGDVLRAAAASAQAATSLVLPADPARVVVVSGLEPPGAPARVLGSGLLLPTAALRDDPVLTSAQSLPALVALATRGTTGASVQEPHLDPSAEVEPGLVSVVVPVWNALAHTKACLESVRRTTPQPFEVVVVDNGSTDGTGAWLAAQADVVVVSNATNRGFAAACNQGMAAARGEVLVLLNNDTLVSRGWTEGLLRALDAGDRVGAAGPRSNSVSGHQRVPDVGYSSPAGYRSAADAWRRQHAGSSTSVERLVGFCLALRREALLETGCLDEGYGTGNFEDDDLCLRLRRAGWELRVAQDVLVHHEGSVTFSQAGTYRPAYLHGLRHHLRKWSGDPGSGVRPLLSVAMIVKDEQRSLPQSLAPLVQLADEVVVCDTGSSDRTVEIAQALGARVVHHTWDDDFAAARNAAQAATRGTWVLHVDADEVPALLDEQELRVALLDAAVDGFAVPIRSVESQDGPGAIEHLMVRVVRAGVSAWRGVVHEAPARLDGAPLQVATLPGLLLEHDGYLPEVYRAKDKGERNRRLAEREYARLCSEDEGRGRWKGAYELARVLAKDRATHVRAEELLRETLALAPQRETSYRTDAQLRLVDVVRAAGRLDEAEALAREAFAAAPGDARARYRLGRVLHLLGRDAEALQVVQAATAGPPDQQDVRDLVCEQRLLPGLHATLLLADGQPGAAAQVLRGVLDAVGPAFTDWGALVQALESTGGAQELARLAPLAPAGALASSPPGWTATVEAGLRAAGLDPQAYRPGGPDAGAVDALVQGHSPDALRAAARALEDVDPAGALLLWQRLPADAVAQVGRARCLVALGRVEEAVAALDDLQVETLDSADLLVVAAVALHVGDPDTALALLCSLPDRDAGTVQEALALAAALGDGAVAHVRAHLTAGV